MKKTLKLINYNPFPLQLLSITSNERNFFSNIMEVSIDSVFNDSKELIKRDIDLKKQE